MNYNVGGYQMIDLSGVTLSSEGAASTVKNRKIADILRTTNKKIVYFYGAKLQNTVVNAIAYLIMDTGVKDGRVYHMGELTVTTNDDEITFGPA